MQDAPAPPRVPPPLVLIAGLLAVSTGALFVRLAAEAHPLAVAAWRTGLAALPFLLLALLRHRPALRQLTKTDLLRIGLAGLCLAAHFAAWIASLHHTAIANSVVLVNTHPLWVGLLGLCGLGERADRRTWAGIGLGILGGLLMEAQALRGSASLYGDGLAVLGGVFAAGYLVAGRSLRARVALAPYAALCYGTAAVVLWSAVGLTGVRWHGFAPPTWGALLGLALISQVVGHTAYNWALRWVAPALVALTLLGEPVLATLGGWLLFHEGLAPEQAAGGLCILAGILLAARRG